MEKIIVDDNYIEDMSKYFETSGNKFESNLKQYLVLMTRFNMHGIAAGETAEAVKSFIEVATLLQGYVGELSETVKSIVGSYHSDIDAADSFLY